MKLFSRNCTIVDESGRSADLEINFFSPKKTDADDEYISKANFVCEFFKKEVYGIGSDPAQSFFVLPKITTSYLIGLRRYGYEVYWLEKGDLDSADFWTYRQ
jgi:hypothetical protein